MRSDPRQELAHNRLDWSRVGAVSIECVFQDCSQLSHEFRLFIDERIQLARYGLYFSELPIWIALK